MLRYFLRRIRRRPRKATGVKQYQEHKETARVRVHEKLLFWNARLGLSYKKVAIRNSRSRWGSCSKAGNLNFNYKLIFIPEDLFDYVVVHELCHLREFNHSPAFWTAVGSVMPDYFSRRRRLRTIHTVTVRSDSSI